MIVWKDYDVATMRHRYAWTCDVCADGVTHTLTLSSSELVLNSGSFADLNGNSFVALNCPKCGSTDFSTVNGKPVDARSSQRRYEDGVEDGRKAANL